MKKLFCAECGEEIKEMAYKFRDNFLQVKYFDNEARENLFCSTDCAAKALMLDNIPIEEILDDYKDAFEDFEDEEN